MNRYLMGIDCGGTFSKAVVFDLQGRAVGVAREAVTLLTPQEGFTERNLEEFWFSVVKAIEKVLSISKVKSDDIAAVGVTGHGKGLYMIGAEGSAPVDGIVSTDSRSMGIVSQLYSSKLFEAIVYPRAMQQIWPGHTAPIMTWMKRNRRDAYDQTEWFLTCKDYIRYRLTGLIAIERTDLSGTGFYNNRERKVDNELLRVFDIEDAESRIPPVIEASDVAGYVSGKTALETGLKKGTPVAGGLFDVNASAVAMQVMKEDDFAAVIGTWSISEYITKDISGIAKQEEHFVVQAHCIPEYWMVHEASPTSCSNYDWFLNKVVFQQCEEKAKIDHNVIEREILERIGTPLDTLFLPFIYGNNLNNEAKGTFINLSSRDDTISMIRSIYEGVAFTHKSHIEKLYKIRSRPSKIRFAGGAVHSNVWMGIFADILELPVEIDEVGELTALGAAMTAGVAVGVYDDYQDAMRKIEKNTHLVEPSAELNGYYRQKYGEYCCLIDVLSSGYWNRK